MPKGKNLMKDQGGFSLIEVLISLALLGILAVTFLGALGTGLKVLLTTDLHQTAMNLAESQMEHVKNQIYAPSYAPDEDILSFSEYANYSVDIETHNITSRDSDIQRIEVIIRHPGEDGAEVMRLEGHKHK